MEQLVEFAGNHALLSLAFIGVLVLLIWTEISRRAQGFTELTPVQAIPLINSKNTVVVDVSASADFNKGHIIGARNILPSRFKNPDPELQKLAGKDVWSRANPARTRRQQQRRWSNWVPPAWRS